MNYFVSGVGDMEAYEPNWCAPWHSHFAQCIGHLGPASQTLWACTQCVTLLLLHATMVRLIQPVHPSVMHVACRSQSTAL